MPTGMLVIGIISIVLSCLMWLQGCALFSLSVIADAEPIGLIGIIASWLFLAAGIVSVAGRKRMGGNLAACILYFLTFFFACSSVSGVHFYAFVSIAFFIVSIVSYRKILVSPFKPHKDEYVRRLENELNAIKYGWNIDDEDDDDVDDDVDEDDDIDVQASSITKKIEKSNIKD